MPIHVVSSGETVSSIARAYQVTSQELIYANQLSNPYDLVVGQALLILNTDENASEEYKYKEANYKEANYKEDSYKEAIFKDDNFQEQKEDPSEAQKQTDIDLSRPYETRFLTTNGYAYPFISPWVLRQTLPYLTRLSIFSYGFTSQGELLNPVLDDQWMINMAKEYRVSPILTLTSINEQGRFDNERIHQLVGNSTTQESLLEQIVETMGQKGFGGLDIDFEYIRAEDKDRFTDFVARARQMLSKRDYSVSVALAPKTSRDQKGLLYEGKDYGGLGAAADQVLLMTYEWGYTYGPPMAVAPINKVREVVEYALTEIPAGKIFLGIPNYGYNWTLPFERGITKARTIGNIEAVTLALRYRTSIEFDQKAQAPYFLYTDEVGKAHEVWFEDVRSLMAKFGLVNEYGLYGVGYWQIMQLFRANWLLLADSFLIQKT